MTHIASNRTRIAVIGTCQVTGIGAALKHLVPHSEIGLWHLGASPIETHEETYERLRGFDLVISQIENAGGSGILDLSHLRETSPNVVYVPVAVFRGFQPDCIYLLNGGGIIKGGLADLHSGIVASAYCLGLPAERVPRLFNSFVYSSLGYFDAFPVARNYMFQTFEAAGYDLRPHMDTWLRESGTFMYTVNHPKICVLSSMALMAAERAGLVPSGTPVPTGVDDALFYSLQWPTYPDIARRIGLTGNLSFIQPHSVVEPGQERAQSLPDFVACCYREYDQLPRASIIAGLPGDALSKLRELVT